MGLCSGTGLGKVVANAIAAPTRSVLIVAIGSSTTSAVGYAACAEVITCLLALLLAVLVLLYKVMVLLLQPLKVSR